jgi:hypothetical protein
LGFGGPTAAVVLSRFGLPGESEKLPFRALIGDDRQVGPMQARCVPEFGEQGSRRWGGVEATTV